MEREFLHDSGFDRKLRRHGEMYYVLGYATVFAVAYLLGADPIFEMPLFGGAGSSAAAASTWAFVLCYPLLHFLLRSRLYASSAARKSKFMACLLGVPIVAFLWFISQRTISGRAITYGAKLLSYSVSSAILQFMAAATASIGIFLVLQALTERPRRQL